MDYKKCFAARLLECRNAADVSQRALGEALGLSDAAITMMERGNRLPSFETLCGLADYFNVSLDYLVGRSSDKQKE